MIGPHAPWQIRCQTAPSSWIGPTRTLSATVPLERNLDSTSDSDWQAARYQWWRGFVELYIRSFDWALPTLVVVVIGNVMPITSAETPYVFLWIVIGVSIDATIIGNVANIVANLETDSTEFVERLGAISARCVNHLTFLRSGGEGCIPPSLFSFFRRP